MANKSKRSAALAAGKLATLCTVIVAWLVVPAAAQQAAVPASALQAYDVELIIFRHLTNNATPEQWSVKSSDAGSPTTLSDEDAEAVPPPGPGTTAASNASYPALAPGKFKLSAMSETLRRSRNYQLIGHIGWTQPGHPRNAAQFMSIDGLLPAGATVLGQVALSRGRYLHLTLDLTLTGGESGERYVLRQTRRMRSNERHYIDHPRFGVIALVTPASE